MNWLRIAHRGASGQAPEHTTRAFERALAIGVDMIELDVQLSRDEELIVMHDPGLARTTDGQGLVRDWNWAELKRLDAGAWFGEQFVGERVLSLAEVLARFGGRVRFNVEIKCPSSADWTILSERLVAVLNAHAQLESAIISCFEVGALEAVRLRSAAARIGVLWDRQDTAEAFRLAGKLHAVSIHPLWSLATQEFVAAAHAQRLQVLAWTVNDVAVMRQLVRRGVDGIMSDFPERFAELAGLERTPTGAG